MSHNCESRQSLIGRRLSAARYSRFDLVSSTSSSTIRESFKSSGPRGFALIGPPQKLAMWTLLSPELPPQVVYESPRSQSQKRARAHSRDILSTTCVSDPPIGRRRAFVRRQPLTGCGPQFSTDQTTGGITKNTTQHEI